MNDLYKSVGLSTAMALGLWYFPSLGMLNILWVGLWINIIIHFMMVPIIDKKDKDLDETLNRFYKSHKNRKDNPILHFTDYILDLAFVCYAAYIGWYWTAGLFAFALSLGSSFRAKGLKYHNEKEEKK